MHCPCASRGAAAVRSQCSPRGAGSGLAAGVPCHPSASPLRALTAGRTPAVPRHSEGAGGHTSGGSAHSAGGSARPSRCPDPPSAAVAPGEKAWGAARTSSARILLDCPSGPICAWAISGTGCHAVRPGAVGLDLPRPADSFERAAGFTRRCGCAPPGLRFRHRPRCELVSAPRSLLTAGAHLCRGVKLAGRGRSVQSGCAHGSARTGGHAITASRGAPLAVPQSVGRGWSQGGTSGPLAVRVH